MTLPIVFMGTPNFAVPALEALIQEGYKVVEVFTQPDRPSGRGKKIQIPPVKKAALEHGLVVSQPKNLTKAIVSQSKSYEDCVFVVCAFGRILSQKILDVPRETINIHASRLPKYRGAAPIHAALKHGDPSAGVSIMKVVYALDQGDVMLTKDTPIEKYDNLGSLTQKLSQLGSSALIEALPLVISGRAQWIPQDDRQASYASKINPQEAKILWDQDAEHIYAFIRSYAPKPGAYSYLDGKPVKIIEAYPTPREGTDHRPGIVIREKKKLVVACGTGAVEIRRIQLQGKKVMAVADFLNGYTKDIDKLG